MSKIRGFNWNFVSFVCKPNLFSFKPNYSSFQQRSTIHQLYDPEKEFYCSLRRKNLSKNCEIPSIFRKTLSASGASSQVSLIEERNEGQRIIRQTELLMPLLFETWMEVRPAKLNKRSVEDDGDDVQISNEAALTLKTIVDVVDRLVELLKLADADEGNTDAMEWFRAAYGQQFCAQFLLGFPYSQSDGFKGSKRKSKGNATEQDVFEAGGPNCFHQNFGVAYLFACINWSLGPKNRIEAERIAMFVQGNLLVSELQSNEVSANLTKFLRIVFIENTRKWLQTVPTVAGLLTTIVSLDEKGKLPKEIRSKIFNFICEVITNRNNAAT